MNANLELIRDLYNQIEDLKAKLEAEKEVLLNDFQSMTTEEIKAIDNKLSAEAMNNADVFYRGDGVNSSDAVAVQKYLAKLINALPEV